MRLLCIDGNSLMNRAFYGIRLLSNRQGVFTNALNTVRERKIDKIVTFRERLLADSL